MACYKLLALSKREHELLMSLIASKDGSCFDGEFEDIYSKFENKCTK